MKKHMDGSIAAVTANVFAVGVDLKQDIPHTPEEWVEIIQKSNINNLIPVSQLYGECNPSLTYAQLGMPGGIRTARPGFKIRWIQIDKVYCLEEDKGWSIKRPNIYLGIEVVDSSDLHDKLAAGMPISACTFKPRIIGGELITFDVYYHYTPEEKSEKV